MFSGNPKARWTIPTARLVACLVVAVLVLPLASGQALADSRCQIARGGLRVTFPLTPPEGCPNVSGIPSPIICAEGRLTGTLKGPFNVNIHYATAFIGGQGPSGFPSLPDFSLPPQESEAKDIYFYIGLFVLHRQAGDVYLVLTGEIDSVERGGDYTQIMTLSGGTGDNAHASGKVLARGRLLPNSKVDYIAEYEGEVCDVK